MIYHIQQLLEQYSKYSDPYNKIKRLCNENKLYKITRSIYCDEKTISPYLISGFIYGPSYISFSYALSYYGLIPERVITITCATTNKRKRKEYENFYGRFSYRDVPLAVFNKEVLYFEENGIAYLIATKEKALCDKLYELTPMKNIKELKELLFEDLRIDEIEFNKLDKDILSELCPLYKSTNLNLLLKMLRNE